MFSKESVAGAGAGANSVAARGAVSDDDADDADDDGDGGSEDAGDSDSDSDSDDDGAGGAAFDLDAQLQAAMTGNMENLGGYSGAGDQLHLLIPGLGSVAEPDSNANANEAPVPAKLPRAERGSSASGSDDFAHTSDDESDSDDEDGGAFDLDAQIGAAMGGLALPDSNVRAQQRTQAQTHMQARRGPSGEDDGALDLQAMLKGAMRQAALEIELELDDLNEAELDELMDFDPDADAFAEGEGLDAEQQELLDRLEREIPGLPRYRPSLHDDGDLGNLFNQARIYHPQALHLFYPCDYRGCDRVVSLAGSPCLSFASPLILLAQSRAH
jgi:hypothetical protein